jgi:hypothetical protein
MYVPITVLVVRYNSLLVLRSRRLAKIMAAIKVGEPA